MALQWSAELEQLLAQAISELYPAASWERWGEVDAGRTVGKCNVCQAVNEQFHGNIVTLLLTAIGAEFLSRPAAAAAVPLQLQLQLQLHPHLHLQLG